MDINIDYSGSELGKYYLIEKIGKGSFGAVYRALDRILKVNKAIKILAVTNPNEAFKLFNEAAIPYKCKHNNIIKINSGEIISFKNELLFVVDMDLANGSSLESILKDTSVSVVDSLSIIKNILFAVEYSHLQKIIHRDIKPANILMDNGVPKLSDFGLATTLGSVITPSIWYISHAAPETFVNSSIATVETDIFALGMTFYRMVNGVSNWQCLLESIPKANELIKSGKLIDKLPLAPFVPDKIHRIIKKACRLLPRDRFQSAAEMRNTIEKLCPLYNWNRSKDDCWKGESVGYPTKEIYLGQRCNVIDITVTNNGRKSSKDSCRFSDLSEAKKYLFEYIKNSTLR